MNEIQSSEYETEESADFVLGAGSSEYENREYMNFVPAASSVNIKTSDG